MMARATPSWSLSYSVMASAASRSFRLGVDHGHAMAAACSTGMSLMLSPKAQASADARPDARTAT